MPLTPFQHEVLDLLATNRSETSHFAGGLALNASRTSVRYSRDFDIFHDAIEDLVSSSEKDIALLLENGFHIEKKNLSLAWERPSSFRRASVIRDIESLELDWACDSAWRFFPIIRDELLGWRLHDFDLAVNKALALSARTETRDYIDIIELSRLFPLEAIIWAACGKDPGFNPSSLLQMMMRFARVNPAELREIQARDLSATTLKEEWLSISEKAKIEIETLANEKPDTPIGVAFVDEASIPRWIQNPIPLHIHHPSLRGCWPTSS